MTTEQFDALRNLPDASPAMRAYTEALAAFIEEDQPGQYRAQAGRITAKDDMDLAWDALRPTERDQVRAIAGGMG